jgi:hypothetical protein
MRRMIVAALAVASLIGTAGTSVAGVGSLAQGVAPSMVTHVQMRDRDWEHDRHCRDWDDRGRACRDHDEGCTRWDMRTHDCRDYARDRWKGVESCRRPGHERFLDRRNRWQPCPRRGGY